jgi:hypothetical protein
VVIRIVLPEATPSLNTFIRLHWTKRRRVKDSWSRLVLAHLPRGPGVEATGKRRLTVERHGKRAIDLDNLAGGLKPVIDTLRAFRLLVDDNPLMMELAVRNAKLARGEAPHTVILLEDL